MEEPVEAGTSETLVCPHCNATSFRVTRRDERSLHLACTSCDAAPLSLEPTLRIWEPHEVDAQAAEAPAASSTENADGGTVALKHVDDREPEPEGPKWSNPDALRAEGEGHADPVVMAELRAWRIAESNRRKVPRYRVLPNRTIEALAQHAPRTLDELEGVWGIGPTRLDRYGGKILEILHGEQHDGGAQLAEA